MTVAEFVLSEAREYDRRTPNRWLYSHIRPHWWPVFWMFFGAFSNAALAAAVPVFIGRAFDVILEDPTAIGALALIAIVLVASQLIRSVLQFARNFAAEVLAQRMERDIRDELYLNLLGKSMTFHNLHPVGDTMARATNDVREINLMFSPGINLVVGSGFFLILPILVAPRYHPSLILVPLLFLIAYIISLVSYLNELRPISEAIRTTFGRMNARLSESIDGIEVVQGSAQEGHEIEHFREEANNYRDAYVRKGDVEARYVALLLFGLAVAAGFFQSILLYRQELIGLGDVIAYSGLLNLFLFPTFVSIFAYSQVSLGLAGVDRILELMNQRNRLDRNPAGHASPMKGSIEFRNVGFRYPDGDPVLENISFKVEPGQTIAIVGQTGAGKTSLAKLVNRTYDVTEGQVLVDGVDVREWELDSLRRRISIIEQDVFLFSRSVEDNLAFGKPSATEEEVRAAAVAAQADEFIKGFQNGYETRLGERGVTFSGGQRQRVALGRAFLTDPTILILDDATSAIDSATEDQIQRAIFQAAEGRTSLIITHRLSQIRWADIIVVLQRGRISAMGPHDDLMKTSESYQRIFTR